jgi:hypothetical protein
MRTLGPDMLGVTPADLQALAQRYLLPGKSWSAIALAKSVPVPVIAPPALPANSAPAKAPAAN